MADRLAPVSQTWRALARVAGRRTTRLVRLLEQSTNGLFAALLAMALACAALSDTFRAQWPLSAYVLPLLLAMNELSMRRLLVLEAVLAACLAFTLSEIHITGLRLVGVIVVLIAGMIVTLHVRSRSRLGVQALRSDSMLVDLRDRLSAQSRLPPLPTGWHGEAVMRPAGGASFSGDFIVATRTEDGGCLEVAVVDVSGKGLEAGTRSLQLSGAFGGLLGSLPPERFLGAANDYVLRQDWSEGFATAVHLFVDLRSGAFEVRTAGHPPAVQFHAGSGRWEPLWTTGPVLGVVGAAEYSVIRGRMTMGDSMMLYTDGLVERPDRAIVFGIDKLLGEAERLVRQGFIGAAERLVASVESEQDDRAIMVLHRR